MEVGRGVVDGRGVTEGEVLELLELLLWEDEDELLDEDDELDELVEELDDEVLEDELEICPSL